MINFFTCLDKKQIILLAIFISLLKTPIIGLSITDTTTNKQSMISTVLTDFEAGSSDWTFSLSSNTHIKTDETDNSFLSWQIKTHNPAPIVFHIPNADKDFSFHREIHYNILSQNQPISTYIALQELSQELWIQKMPKTIPVSNQYHTIKVPLYQGFFSLHSPTKENQKLDFNQIRKIYFFSSLSSEITRPDTLIQLDQLIAIGELPNLILETAHLHHPDNISKAPTFSANSVEGDQSPPEIIDLLINDTPYLNADYIPQLPSITAKITELDSGIATWNIVIKNAETAVTINHTSGYLNGKTGNEVSVSSNISVSLEDGSYFIIANAQDQSGHWSNTLRTPTLNVISSFQVKKALNGPNPFNPNKESTFIQYSLTQPANIKLYIYSISGERLWSRSFMPGEVPGGGAGFNSIEWTGRNRYGEIVANGPYVCYLTANANGKKKIKKIKMLVLK